MGQRGVGNSLFSRPVIIVKGAKFPVFGCQAKPRLYRVLMNVLKAGKAIILDLLLLRLLLKKRAGSTLLLVNGLRVGALQGTQLPGELRNGTCI